MFAVKIINSRILGQGENVLIDRYTNKRVVHERIKDFLGSNEAGVCVVSDFDECLVEEFLSRALSETYHDRFSLSPTSFNNNYDGLSRLLEVYTGLTRRELILKCRRLAGRTSWRPNAKELLQSIIRAPNYCGVILSSGLNLLITEMLLCSGLNSFPVIACDLEFDSEGICVGPSLIIDARMKGSVVKQLVQSGKYEKVYAIGHSIGDRFMLQEATGIILAVDKQDNALCNSSYMVQDFSEVADIIGIK